MGDEQTRITYDWKAIASKARKADGAFVLAQSDAPAAAVYRVRHRRHPDLHHPDGYLQAELRQRHTTEDGSVRGDLYVSWVRARRT